MTPAGNVVLELLDVALLPDDVYIAGATIDDWFRPRPACLMCGASCAKPADLVRGRTDVTTQAAGDRARRR